MPKSDTPTGEGVDVEGLGRYLAREDVVFAILFGSHAQGTAEEASDVDIALRFPDDMGDHEQFRRRNRIDADLQRYAPGFVDVRDIETLPRHVAYAALRDGILLAGDEQAAESSLERVETEYDDTASEREKERREFIDRIARGDM